MKRTEKIKRKKEKDKKTGKGEESEDILERKTEAAFTAQASSPFHVLDV